MSEKPKPGRPSKLSPADKHEVRRYREAGVSISRLASMWQVSTTRIYEILAEQLAAFKTELRRLKEEAISIQEQPSPAEWPEWINEVRA